MRIGIDVDGVIADNHTAWLNRVNDDSGINPGVPGTATPDDLTQWEFWKDIGCTREQLFKHWTPDIYRDVLPYADALDAVKAIVGLGHEVMYITSCLNAEEWQAKDAWLHRHGFHYGRTMAFGVGPWAMYKSKAEVAATHNVEWLIDDAVPNVESWPGYALLLTRPHNKNLQSRCKRIRTLDDAVELLRHTPADKSEPPALVASAVNPVAATGNVSPGEKPSNPKDMIGSSKLPLHLWPETASMLGCLALLDGALKYGRSNFRAIGVRSSIYYDAARRHLNKWFEGEEHDPDSGLPHLSHALACIAIIVDAQAAGKLNDDRMYPGGYTALSAELTPHVTRLKALYADKSPKHYTCADATA